MRVLIASPVKQSPPVLEAFLHGLGRLRLGIAAQAEILLVDDNDDAQSARLLRRFAEPGPAGMEVRVTTPPSDAPQSTRVAYRRSLAGHFWNRGAVSRIGAIRQDILEYARLGEYDALLMIDSDLVLRPETLEVLLATGKDIVAEVFWTAWSPGAPPGPNVWDTDEAVVSPATIDMLGQPGLYRVGGLGACTCIRRRALATPIGYAPLYNVSWWGEDRHFCIRAVALGFELWADTHCPPLHLYRDSDVARVPTWLSQVNPHEARGASVGASPPA